MVVFCCPIPLFSSFTPVGFKWNSLTCVLLDRHMPGHASREILILFGSLTSCDPGDIQETVQVQ